MSRAKIRSIYLAGPIEYDKDGGMSWRNSVKRDLKTFDIEGKIPQDLNKEQELPPEKWSELRYSDLDRFRREFYNKIIKPDIHGMLQCNAVFVWWNGAKSSGTHAEATYARMNEVPVFLFLADNQPLDSVPSWLLACTTEVFDDPQDFYAYLKGWNAALSGE